MHTCMLEAHVNAHFFSVVAFPEAFARALIWAELLPAFLALAVL